MQQLDQQILKQQSALDSMLKRVQALLRHRRDDPFVYDRWDYSYVGDVVFPQNDATARDIVFTVPENQEFVGKRLSFYPWWRQVTIDKAANGANQVPFRPCIFTGSENAYLAGGLAEVNSDVSADLAAVDAFVTLSETFRDRGAPRQRFMQNMPTPISLFYSGQVNYRPRPADANTIIFPLGPVSLTIESYYNSFEFPSGLLFDHDYVLPGGSSFRINVAPSFASSASASEASGDPQHEYKLVAVLEGYKRRAR